MISYSAVSSFAEGASFRRNDILFLSIFCGRPSLCNTLCRPSGKDTVAEIESLSVKRNKRKEKLGNAITQLFSFAAENFNSNFEMKMGSRYSVRCYSKSKKSLNESRLK